MMEDTSIMENSICKFCVNRICRIIIPPDYYIEEMGDINEEEEQDDDSENQVIEHNYCTALLLPLDHVVLDCNRFYPIEEVTIIKNDAMFGS
jgi:hypothetical protein